jgi:hypothetical protein
MNLLERNRNCLRELNEAKTFNEKMSAEAVRLQ